MIEKEKVVEGIKSVIDPDLMIDIWTLGLIYDIQIENQIVDIKMTFTTPMCPSGPYLVEEVNQKVKTFTGAEKVNVEVVFSPPWQPSEELKMMMGI